MYHRQERRKVKNLLTEQKKYGTEVFKCYKEPCCLYGDACYVDDGYWCDDPNEYVLNFDGTDVKNYLICIGCRYSENHFKNYEYAWDKEPCEDIVNGIDRSLKFADKYTWSSDGGQYWTADILKTRKRFEKDVFGIEPSWWKSYYTYKYPTNIWEKYVKYRDAANNKEHPVWITRKSWDGKIYCYWARGPKQADSDWDLMEFLFHRKLIPMSFWGPEDLVSWLRSHEEEIIRKWFKARLLRK